MYLREHEVVLTDFNHFFFIEYNQWQSYIICERFQLLTILYHDTNN